MDFSSTLLLSELQKMLHNTLIIFNDLLSKIIIQGVSFFSGQQLNFITEKLRFFIFRKFFKNKGHFINYTFALNLITSRYFGILLSKYLLSYNITFSFNKTKYQITNI